MPQPFGGKYRQIMVYVDPAKLQSYQLSPMDVVRAVNNANLILPAGDVKIGPLDYALYTNSQFPTVKDINDAPIKTVGMSTVTVGDVGQVKDAYQIQTNVVRVNGQPSVYLPIMKQGGDTNTIAVVDGVKETLAHLTNIPKELVTNVVFDQSLFVKRAIETLLHEGGDRPGADGVDGAGVPGQLPGDDRGVPVDSAVGARGVHRAVFRRQLDQHHDPRRPCAGVFPADRQRGDRAREHLPAPRAGRVARGCGRAGRRRRWRWRSWRRR